MGEGVPKNLNPENNPEAETKKRLGGALVGKPIRGADGKWFNQFGEEVPAPENRKRPGGVLEGKPVQGPDGKWFNQFGEEVEAPQEKNSH